MRLARATREVQIALLGEAADCATGAAVFVWDEDRNYVAVNDYACTLVGLTREELLTMSVGAMTPDGASTILDEAQRVPSLRGRSTIVRRDETTIEVEYLTLHTKVAGLPYMVSVVWPFGGAR